MNCELHPGAIPGSHRQLNIPADKDNNVIFAVTCMRQEVNDYIKVLKKNGYYAQQFDYDLQEHQGKE